MTSPGPGPGGAGGAGPGGRASAAPGGRAGSAPLLGHDAEPTVFDLSVPGRRAASFRTTGVPEWAAVATLIAIHAITTQSTVS